MIESLESSKRDEERADSPPLLSSSQINDFSPTQVCIRIVNRIKLTKPIADQAREERQKFERRSIELNFPPPPSRPSPSLLTSQLLHSLFSNADSCSKQYDPPLRSTDSPTSPPRSSNCLLSFLPLLLCFVHAHVSPISLSPTNCIQTETYICSLLYSSAVKNSDISCLLSLSLVGKEGKQSARLSLFFINHHPHSGRSRRSLSAWGSVALLLLLSATLLYRQGTTRCRGRGIDPSRRGFER